MAKRSETKLQGKSREAHNFRESTFKTEKVKLFWVIQQLQLFILIQSHCVTHVDLPAADAECWG